MNMYPHERIGLVWDTQYVDMGRPSAPVDSGVMACKVFELSPTLGDGILNTAELGEADIIQARQKILDKLTTSSRHVILTTFINFVRTKKKSNCSFKQDTYFWA